jgi:hypothetical protein
LHACGNDIPAPVRNHGNQKITKLFLSVAIAAAAIGTAALASAEPGNPFSHLCMGSQCSTPAPAGVRHVDISQVEAGIQQGLHDVQSAPSPGH